MIHRRNSLVSNHRVTKAPITGHGGWHKNMASNTSLKVSWKKELEHVLQDPLSSMPKLIRHGNKTRAIVLAAVSLILLVSLTHVTLSVATWVETWADAVRYVPTELISEPPLLPSANILPFNDIYRIPESHPQAGDRSDEYALLRQEIDRLLPYSPSRSLKAVKDIRQAHGSTNYTIRPMRNAMRGDYQETYDIYNCPDQPPVGYPFAWSLADVLSSWPPKDTADVSERAVYQGLCVFQFPQDFAKALHYRHLELPFVMRGDPHIARTVERWQQPNYLSTMLTGKHRCEYSPNNHFLYQTPGSRQTPGGTQLKFLTYDQWLDKANVTQDRSGPDQEHWYFRLIGCGSDNKHNCDPSMDSEYLFDELPMLQPTWQANHDGVAKSAQLYMGKEGHKQNGIHCRFGMRGVIAENHFDSTRNVIVLLGGSRRYILAAPNQCQHMSLYPANHPSARHSNFDWSSGDVSTFPDDFAQHAMGNEVVLQAGDAMYLPTFWFHYIVSLELNYQCNTRSGVGMEYATDIEKCG